jgi:hypothetical protein
VSDDPAIARFVPHRAPTALSDEPLVWAIDTRHLPLYWFPRDCPRCTFWASDATTDGDVDAFLRGDRDRRVHVIEDGWQERVRTARLFVYAMPPDTFVEDADTAGYWTSGAAVVANGVSILDALVDRHAAAGIELRAERNLWPLWDRVVSSTLAFSGIRLRNALARPHQASR